MKGDSVKKWLLAFGIAIIFNLFINYGIFTFYEGPDYLDYCEERFPKPIVIERSQCTQLAVTEEFEDECRENEGMVQYNYDDYGCETEAYCETCGKAFREARDPYERNVFVMLIVIGLIAIIAGVILKVEAVSSGFLLGGILCVIIGTMRYWGHFQNYARFVILGLVLAFLVWLGYKKLK